MRFSLPVPVHALGNEPTVAPAAAVSQSTDTRMDEDAFQVCYDATASTLRGYIRRVANDVAVADDILQETFLRFLRSVPAGLEERQQKAYLYRTATSLLADHRRRASRERLWSMKSLSTERLPGPSPLTQDVPRLFARLKPREQALLWLAYVEGFDHGEIASALQLRQTSVRVLLFRARKKLAGILTRHGLGPGPTGADVGKEHNASEDVR